MPPTYDPFRGQDIARLARARKEKADRKRALEARKRAATSKKVAERRADESRAVARGSDPKRVARARKIQAERDKRKVLYIQAPLKKGSAAMDVLPALGFEKKDIKEVEQAVAGIPAGLFGIAKALALDVARPKRKAIPFSRTREIGKEIAKSTYRDVRHPRRNPLMTALTVSGLASAGAGTAARGAAAAKAGSVKGAAKAAIQRPLPGPRVHTYEGQPIRGRYSPNASARAVQRARDKATGGKIGVRKAERLLSEERRVTDAAAKAPALKALANAQPKRSFRRKGISTPEDAAIRVVAEGIPLDDVIEAHRQRAAVVEKKIKHRRRGGVPAGGASNQQALRLNKGHKDLLRKAAILEEARKYLDVDADGRPIISSKHPELQRRYDVGEKAAGTRESRLKAAGLLTREQAESRVHAPGRAMVRTVSGGRAVKVERPRTIGEAKARVEELEGTVEKAIQAIIDAEGGVKGFIALKGQGGKQARTRTQKYMTDVERKQNVAGGEYLEPQSSLPTSVKSRTQQARENAIAKLEELRNRPNPHPVVKMIADAADELHDLRTAIRQTEGGGVFEDLPEPGALGSVDEFKAFEDVEPFVGGRFRVPDVLRSKKLPHGPSAYRGGVPRKPGTLTHGYTGSLRRSGKYTGQTLKAIAEDALEAERYLSVERFRQRVLPMGKKVRPQDTRRVKYVPVRTRPLKREESTRLRKMLEDAEIEKLTPDEAARIEQAVKAWERNLFPEEGIDTKFATVGETIPGVVWVDRKLLGSQRKLIGSLGPLDVAQDAVKGLILYGKPGYVTPNVLGNLGYNLFQQGFLAAPNFVRAVRLPKDLGFMVDEVMGAGFSRALAEGTTSPISRAVRGAGNFWSHFVDQPFRRSSFIHEARKVGVKSNDDLRTFIERHDPQYAETAQRARDAIVDYERLGPIERDIVRRVLFVYPWIKGSTYYAAQFLRDHPIQAAVFAKIGEQGKEQSLEELGPLPAWAQGSFKVGGSDERPMIVNPTAISPFSTPGQVLAAGRGLTGGAERSENIGEMASPLAQGLIEAGFSRDLFTGRELGGSFPERLVGQVGKGLPQYQLYKRLREADDPKTQEKSYPYGRASAIGQFLGGSSSPRPANLDVLNEQATTRSPGARLSRRMETEENELVAGLQQASPGVFAENPGLRKTIDQAYKYKQAVTLARAQARLEAGDKEPYRRARLRREAALLRQFGFADREEVATMKRISMTGSIEAVDEVLAELHDTWEELYLDPLLELKHEVAGVP